MIETPAFSVGLIAGVILGALAVGFWLSTRLRSRFHSQLFSAAERAQRAETLADELRRHGEADRAELDRLRHELSEVARARAVAETQASETAKHAEEQKALLTQARHELAEAFQALSGEALKQNNEAFLNLAKTSFQTLHAEAKGDLVQRQQAINELVKPLAESLGRYD